MTNQEKTGVSTFESSCLTTLYRKAWGGECFLETFLLKVIHE